MEPYILFVFLYLEEFYILTAKMVLKVLILSEALLFEGTEVEQEPCILFDLEEQMGLKVLIDYTLLVLEGHCGPSRVE
jgi:hypothetical protein